MGLGYSSTVQRLPGVGLGQNVLIQHQLRIPGG
jgi:hypothetical protein